MLKKAGIVVAAAAAALLAVSPLAFAGDKGGYDHGTGSVSSVEENSNAAGDENVGLVNVTGNNLNAPIQACNNDTNINGVGGQVTDITSAFTGVIGFLAEQDVDTSTEQSENRDCTQDATAGDSLVQGIG